MRVSKNSFKKVQELPMKTLDVDVTTHITSVKSRYDSGEADVLVSAGSPYGKEKKSITWDFGRKDQLQTIRVIRFKLDNGEYETLVTSLLDREEFPAELFIDLYHMRWGIETSFRELKYNIGVANLHTVKDEFIIQEIWAKLAMYNFSMAIAMSVALPKMKKHQYAYAVDRTMAISICLRFFRGRGGIDLKNIVWKIQQYLQPIRPGRKDRRKALKPKQFVPFVYRVAA